MQCEEAHELYHNSKYLFATLGSQVYRDARSQPTYATIECEFLRPIIRILSQVNLSLANAESMVPL